MSREDPFRVRFTSFPAVGESNREEAVLNSMGMQVVVDLFTQLALSGFTFHVQFGTENAGATTTGALDDALATILVDQTIGSAMFPLHYQCLPGLHAGATIAQAMLEIDKEIIRFVSGGTVFVAEALMGLDRNSHAGAAYVAGASDIVAATKSAVPDSVELARVDFTEAALADTIGYPGGWRNDVYDVRTHAMAIATDAASIVGHFGAAGADLTGYASMQFAQFPKAQLGAS